MSKASISRPDPRARSTRAQRRAAERITDREARRRTEQKRRLPLAAIVGAVITLLFVVVIGTRTYIQMNTIKAGAVGGLADPNALAPSSALISTGTTAPNFTLSDTHGQTYNLAAQRGAPMVLEFYAVWCPICHGEAPVMHQIVSAYAASGVHVWSVLSNPYGKDYDTSGRSDLRLANASDVSWYARTFNTNYPQLVDPKFQTVNQYGVSGYPTIYVLDKKGVIRFAGSGRETYAALARALDKALGAPGSA